MATTTTQMEKTPPPAAGAANQLTAGLQAAWTRARVHWAGLQAGQRRWAMASAGMLAALLIALAWYGLRTDWRTLYGGMEPDEARQMAITLNQAQIPYQVAENGTSLLVPSTQLDKARLATAAKGAVKSGKLGFELFDKPNWVGSEFDERVNYQRALEGELEHTIGTLSDIESARVDLVLPHDSLFRDEARPAKASVVLKLRHAGLADGEAESIRNLVASAVDGLSPDRVVLVDAAGRLQLGPKTDEALRLSAEQVLEQKIASTLEPVTGAGNVRVSVALDYDQAATDQTDETYDPDQSATLTMQRAQQTVGQQPVAAGVPGAASNAPNTNAQQLPVYPKLTSGPETSSSEAGTYGVSKTVKHSVVQPGRVRRMTAAIVVNDRLLRAATKNSPAQYQPWSPDALRNLTALAQASIGYDQQRGDVVTVQDIAFDGNRAATPPSLPAKVWSVVVGSPELIKYAALLLGLLLVLMLGVRPAVRRARGIPEKQAKKGKKGAGDKDAKELPAVPAQPAMPILEAPALDPERIRAQEIFDQVTAHLKQEPTQSSRLLQSWLHTD
ncbi:MAG: flagellar basal-body MS-ring/collar protein FliF [Acidobacteriaceae bacterium]|nr:flagellar basal-body MS-ring/collar protein FliF [Acidobacteriaceae bacterium]